jgi:hypothetical protein
MRTSPNSSKRMAFRGSGADSTCAESHTASGRSAYNNWAHPRGHGDTVSGLGLPKGREGTAQDPVIPYTGPEL